jgi:hypothetical protein
MHLAAVDGDGGSNQPEPRAPTDPFGDDVFVVRMRMCEEWSPCDTSFDEPAGFESPAGYGCAFRAGSSGGAAWLVALLALLRRSRWAALALLAWGCFDPVLAEDCPAGICGEAPGAPLNVAASSSTGAGGTGGAAGAAGAAGTAGAAGAASSSSSGPFMPTHCECDGCMTHAQCAAACDPPTGVYACFFPKEGCWLVAQPCTD